MLSDDHNNLFVIAPLLMIACHSGIVIAINLSDIQSYILKLTGVGIMANNSESTSVFFRLSEEELDEVKKIIPVGKKISGFMKEMSLIGINYAIGNPDKLEKKLIREVKSAAEHQQTVTANLSQRIAEMDKKMDSLSSTIMSNVTIGLITQLKPVLEDIFRNMTERGRFSQDGSKNGQAVFNRDHLQSGSDDLGKMVNRVSAISDALIKLSEMGVFKQYLDKEDLKKIQGR